MRRLFLSVLVAGGLAFLAACSGQGGYGFSSGGTNNSNVDRIAFSNGSGGDIGIFYLAPGAATIEVNASGVRGSQSVVVPDALFTWSAAIAPNSAFYQTNTVGQNKQCPTPSGTPAVPLFVGNVLTSSGLGGAISAPIPYDGRATTTIFVGSPALGVTPPYCIQVIAKSTNGVQGGVVVFVSN